MGFQGRCDFTNMFWQTLEVDSVYFQGLFGWPRNPGFEHNLGFEVSSVCSGVSQTMVTKQPTTLRNPGFEVLPLGVKLGTHHTSKAKSKH
jgi:hypothetical protein